MDGYLGLHSWHNNASSTPSEMTLHANETTCKEKKVSAQRTKAGAVFELNRSISDDTTEQIYEYDPASRFIEDEALFTENVSNLDCAQEIIDQLRLSCRHLQRKLEDKTRNLKEQEEVNQNLLHQLSWKKKQLQNLLSFDNEIDSHLRQDLEKYQIEIKQLRLEKQRLMATVSQLHTQLHVAESREMQILTEFAQLRGKCNQQFKQLRQGIRELLEENSERNKANSQLKQALHAAETSLELQSVELIFQESQMELKCAREAKLKEQIDNLYEEYCTVCDTLKETQDRLDSEHKKNEQLTMKLQFRCGCTNIHNSHSTSSLPVFKDRRSQSTCCLHSARYTNVIDCTPSIAEEIRAICMNGEGAPKSISQSERSDIDGPFPLPTGESGVPGSGHLGTALKYLYSCENLDWETSTTVSTTSSTENMQTSASTEQIKQEGRTSWRESLLQKYSAQTLQLVKPFVGSKLLQRWSQLANPTINNINESRPGIYLQCSTYSSNKLEKSFSIQPTIEPVQYTTSSRCESDTNETENISVTAIVEEVEEVEEHLSYVASDDGQIETTTIWHESKDGWHFEDHSM